MLNQMPKSRTSLFSNTFGKFMRFGMLRGLRSVEIDPEDFRQHLSDKYDLWVPHFQRMRDVPIERLDAVAQSLIHEAERLALAGGAGFGLGGMITLIPDTGLLTMITLRLLQHLCLLYGYKEKDKNATLQLWMAAGAAAGIDLGKDFAEKQVLEKLAPRIAGRIAAKIGQESAEKWVGRLIPLAGSAIGGALNYSFVRTWGRRVHPNLRERHLAARIIPLSPAALSAPAPSPAQ